MLLFADAGQEIAALLLDLAIFSAMVPALLLGLLSILALLKMRDGKHSSAYRALGILDVIGGMFGAVLMLFVGPGTTGWTTSATLLSGALFFIGLYVLRRDRRMQYPPPSAGAAPSSDDDAPPVHDDDGWESEHPPPSSFS